MATFSVTYASELEMECDLTKIDRSLRKEVEQGNSKETMQAGDS